MSEKKQTGLKNIWSVIVSFFRGTKAEVKRVIWPTWKEIFNNTTIVISTVILVGLVMWALGLMVVYGVRLIVS